MNISEEKNKSWVLSGSWFVLLVNYCTSLSFRSIDKIRCDKRFFLRYLAQVKTDLFASCNYLLFLKITASHRSRFEKNIV